MVVRLFIIPLMDLGKIVIAVLIFIVGTVADWFSIVWGMANEVPTMYIILVVLILTDASIWLIIWDLRS